MHDSAKKDLELIDNLNCTQQNEILNQIKSQKAVNLMADVDRPQTADEATARKDALDPY